jgi:hypothetical protein
MDSLTLQTCKPPIWSFTVALPMSHLLDVFGSYHVILDLDLPEFFAPAPAAFRHQGAGTRTGRVLF